MQNDLDTHFIYMVKKIGSLDTNCGIEKNSSKSIYNINPPTQPL